MSISENHTSQPIDGEAPGRVYVETYGCSFNVSDGEVMAGLLKRDGFELVSTPDQADAVIVNSCTVKDRTWLDLKKRLAELGRQTPAVVLAGCAPKVPHQAEHLKEWSQIGPNNIADIPSVVRSTLAGQNVRHTDVRHDEKRLEFPSVRRNPRIEILPISKGCLGACTFCQTVIARGRLKSFPPEQILDRIRRAVDEGVTQVWLTSQDCGAYGLDIGTNLARLMQQIADMPGDFIVRVGMANPDLINLYLDDFARILAHPRFYQFAHVPLQAGSDTVLQDMKRMYTVDEFRRICETLRKYSPHVTIATDIIVGFPTESDADFQQTVDVLRETAIPVVNRSRYSPRPGTPAARLKLLPSAVVSARSKALYKAACEIAFDDLDRWANWRGPVTVEEPLKSKGVVLARNFAYKPVILPVTDASHALASVNRRERFHLAGSIVGSNAVAAG